MENRGNPEAIVIARYFADSLGSDLQNPFWESCLPVQITHQWSGEPAPRSRSAEVCLCWNEEALTVRFRGEQHEPLVISDRPVLVHKTLGLWDRDVCEIFVAPDPDQPERYFEFEAAPTGEWVDLGIVLTPSGRETDWDFASGMEVATKIGSEEIIVAMTIPWSTRIPRPEAGAEWRTNLFRCVGSDEATRYLAWRPTHTPEPNFHVSEAFGVLRFT